MNVMYALFKYVLEILTDGISCDMSKVFAIKTWRFNILDSDNEDLRRVPDEPITLVLQWEKCQK
jgi:hypothetical protein